MVIILPFLIIWVINNKISAHCFISSSLNDISYYITRRLVCVLFVLLITHDA